MVEAMLHHQTLIGLLREIQSTPTAPFHEALVAEVIRKRLANLPNVSLTEDDFGNIIAHYKKGRSKPQLAFGAHMDHPGWVRTKKEGEVFLGWVPEERLKTHPVEWFGDFGMWKLNPFVIHDGLIHSRVCDDLIGCAAIVAMLMDLSKRGVDANCYGIFTRAEEVGFIGAVKLAKKWPLPKSVRFVSLETSAARGGAVMGDGPVIRAGDRMSLFDDAVTAELVDAGAEGKIPVQRCLLDGGSCEATAMNLYGIPAAGMSVILGNYHNCPPERGIAEEFVSLADVKNMIKLITVTVERMAGPNGKVSSKDAMRKRIEKRVRDHEKYDRAARGK